MTVCINTLYSLSDMILLEDGYSKYLKVVGVRPVHLFGNKYVYYR